MNQKGFTLIELVIVSAVFLFVIGGATIIFISMINHQRNILKEHEFLNQISYAEEYMSKALRMAKTSTTVEDSLCIPGGNIYKLTRESGGYYRGVKFINQSDNDACQEFFWDASGVMKEAKGALAPVEVPVTSESLEILSARFGINGGNGCFGGENCPDGAIRTDGIQPRITILLTVKIESPDQQPERVMQTTVSQRNINPQ